MSDYSIEATNRFLNYYKDLEKLEKDEPEKYNFLYSNYRSQLDMFRHIRNDLTHNSVNHSFPIIVSQEVCDTINRLLFLVKKKAIDYAIKKKDIVFVKLDNTIADAIELMSINHFSHLPIIDENERIIGVVSQESIINIFYKEGITSVIKNKLKIYVSYFGLEKNDEKYLFIPKDYLVIDLNEILYSKENKKIGAVFITPNGKHNETIVGMMRAYDIIESLQY